MVTGYCGRWGSGGTCVAADISGCGKVIIGMLLERDDVADWRKSAHVIVMMGEIIAELWAGKI